MRPRVVPGWTCADADLLGINSSGRVFTRCPPSSVVERVLGKNEVTGSIPVGGSEWEPVSRRFLTGLVQVFLIRGGVAQLVRAHDS